MSINISELIWTVICFFVLLVVLKKLLFDPLVSFMAARDARIQDGLNAGRTAQQQLDKLNGDVEPAAPSNKVITGFDANIHTLLPIPLTEIQLNKDGNLKQNPGY